MVLLLVGVISKFANHTMRKSLWWAPGTLSNCESEVTVQREMTKKKKKKNSFFFFFLTVRRQYKVNDRLIQGGGGVKTPI